MNIKSEKSLIKYLCFIMCMVVLIGVCFGVVLVFAEPPLTEGLPLTEPTEEPTIVETDTPATSTIANTPQPTTQPPVTSITANVTTPPVVSNTVSTQTNGRTPENGTTNPGGLTPSASQDTSEPTTTEEDMTTSFEISYTPFPTPVEVTVAPVQPGDAMPTPQGNIVSKGDVYIRDMEQNLRGYSIYIAAAWDIKEDGSVNENAIAIFEEKYNCDVVFLHMSEAEIYNRIVMSCATGQTFFDGVMLDASTILTDFEPLDMLEEFSKYLTQEEIDAIPVSYRKVLGKEDRLYGIPAYAPDFSGMWVNQSLVGEFKITNPLVEYNAGKWSWNNFVKILYDAIGPKGDLYSYGLATSSNIVSPVLESTGASLIRWTGKDFISGATNKITVSGLTLVENLYTSHYMANNYESYFYTDKTAFLAGEISMYSYFKKYMPKRNVSFFPMPSNTGGNEGVSVATSAYCGAIVKSSRYPAHTAELLQLIYGGEKFKGRTDKFCVDNNFTPQITQVYNNMLKNFTVDYSSVFDKDGKMRNTLMSILKNGTFSEEASKKEIEQILQKLIDRRTRNINLKEIPVQIKW